MPAAFTEQSANLLPSESENEVGPEGVERRATAPHDAMHRGAVLAFVALGSNLHNPRRQVECALGALAQLPACRLIWQSSLYLSAPVGGVVQPPFINAVAALWTRLAAEELLASLHTLEHNAGRRRAEESYWGPRILDLDLLSHGARELARPDLTLPHPRLHERAFVLLPLSEYDPDWNIPGKGPLSHFLPAVAGQPILRLRPGDHRDLAGVRLRAPFGGTER